MHVSRIRLKNFRGYYSLSLDFSSGMNVFIGKNASGKTNLLEAIHYLSFAKSFRGVEDSELIQNKASKAVINAEVVTDEGKKTIDVLITEKGKKILVNDKGINKLSSLNKITNVIIFTPQDVNIFRDSPKNRRNYLDINISKLNSMYGEVISLVENLLKERSEILKQDEVDSKQLEIVTDQLIKAEKEVIVMRKEFIANLNKVISKVVNELKGGENKVKVIYFPYIKLDDDYLAKAKKLYQDNLDNDLKRKATSIGVHREDFILTLNGEDISVQGSQGENRLMAISLKLSPYFLVDDKSKHPIVALDDVMSELDDVHQKKLISFLRKLDQVFITSTKLTINQASIYEIDNHHAIRRTK
ncbi:MAG: DNA replication/repair protein RecF [Bacilli bacterium]|nr:DNA replication/repair protein RecF [Bacilli bacterium]